MSISKKTLGRRDLMKQGMRMITNALVFCREHGLDINDYVGSLSLDAIVYAYFGEDSIYQNEAIRNQCGVFVDKYFWAASKKAEKRFLKELQERAKDELYIHCTADNEIDRMLLEMDQKTAISKAIKFYTNMV